MNKNTIRGMLGMAVLLVLYILVAFLIPFVHTAVFWVSFVFTLIAFGVVGVSFYIAFIINPDSHLRSDYCSLLFIAGSSLTKSIISPALQSITSAILRRTERFTS